jgi:SH3 domain-containing protein
MIRRILITMVAAAVLTGTLAAAQDSTASAAGGERHAVVARNVNLRQGPSTATPRIRLLLPPDELTLREDTATSNFYPVRTEDDEDGWVWARNIRVLADSEAPVAAVVAAPAPAAAAAAVATSVDDSWEKPAPNHSSFTSGGKHCGATGDGGDEETNLRKNRTDLPSSYHDVTFKAIADQPYPVGPKHRHDWPAESLAKIQKFEGAALRVQGYLVALKPQTGGSGESTNCHFTHANEVDWHLALVGDVGQGEDSSVVIETTPRIRHKHSHWTVANLKPWVDADAPVRISGWLMFDPEHRNHLGKYRRTLWEIHPITRIEVWQDGTWKDLDDLP